MQHKKPK